MNDKKVKKRKKNKRWVRPYHRFVRNLLNVTLGVYARAKYNAKIEKIKDSNKRPYLILYNHQTGFDQFFVGMTCKRPVYQLATEDIFSMGLASRLIEFLVKPIPIKKQTTDPRAVINCIKVAKEGGTIAIAPEGNRTYDGRTCYIKPTIASLAKHLGLPIAFVKLIGGYGVQPRWSDGIRSGGMTVKISRVVEPEEYKNLSDDELVSLIRTELWQDESVYDKEYRSKTLAEHLERAIYVCPDCKISSFGSRGDLFYCKRCNRTARHLPNGVLEGVDAPLPFRSVAEWYSYQENYIRSLDLSENTETLMAQDDVSLYNVILYDKKRLISKKAEISLYGDRITLKYGDESVDVRFSELSAASVLGKNKMNLYYQNKVYQIKGAPDFCALKYVNIYYRFAYLKGENKNEFMGL